MSRNGDVRTRCSGATSTDARILRAESDADRRGDSTQASRPRQEREGHLDVRQASVHRSPVSSVNVHFNVSASAAIVQSLTDQ